MDNGGMSVWVERCAACGSMGKVWFGVRHGLG